MLMVNSAVKVGSQGSKPIEWNTYAQNQEEYSIVYHKLSFYF